MATDPSVASCLVPAVVQGAQTSEFCFGVTPTHTSPITERVVFDRANRCDVLCQFCLFCAVLCLPFWASALETFTSSFVRVLVPCGLFFGGPRNSRAVRSLPRQRLLDLHHVRGANTRAPLCAPAQHHVGDRRHTCASVAPRTRLVARGPGTGAGVARRRRRASDVT